MLRKIGFGLAMLLILSGLGGISLAGDEVTLQGQFVWNTTSGEEVTGDLKAIFTPTGEDAWDLAFHFEWEGEAKVYSGTVHGSLSEGALEGEVNDGGEGENRHTYRIRGSFKDGEFAGVHTILSNEDGPRDLGTLTLRPVD